MTHDTHNSSDAPCDRAVELVTDVLGAGLGACALTTDEPKWATKKAHQILAQTVPIRGTVAERYLINTRGIPASDWPPCITFYPPENALAAEIATEDGEILGVHLIRLTRDGKKISDSGKKHVKQSYGNLRGAPVRLPGPPDAPLLLAEGPETALSVWAVSGFETWIALGGMSKLQPPAGRRIIVCADDDPRDSGMVKSLRKAVSIWKRQGINVVVANPWTTRRRDHSDFNDVIKEGGPDAVSKRLQLFAKNARSPDDTVPINKARDILAHRVGEFFEAARQQSDGSEGLVFVHAIGVTTGVGKTEEALRNIALHLRRARQDGDIRAVVYAVPQHRLSTEVAARFTAMAEPVGLIAEIWRGREAVDPDGADDARMCRDIETIKEAQKVLADLDKDVCAVCRFKNNCAYLQQRDRDADLWIVAHQLIFFEAPQPIQIRGVSALIVDESPWAAGLIGTSGDEIQIPLDALDPGVMPLPNERAKIGRARLQFLRTRLKESLADEPDGPVRRGALFKAGLRYESGTDGVELEFRRKIVEGAWSERNANRTLMPMVLVWKAVRQLLAFGGPELSGWLSVRHNETGARVLSVTGRRKIHDDWKLPTLLIDALLDEELVKPYWPNIEVVERLKVGSPFAKIYQYADRAFSKAMLAPVKGDQPDGQDGQDGQDGHRRRRNRQRVVAFIKKVDRENGGETLVITNKVIEAALSLPPNIAVAHFNALAGRDEWRDVSNLIVVGMPQPRPVDVERMAGALTGEAPSQSLHNPAAGGGWDWYHRADVYRQVRDGDEVEAIIGEGDVHPDELAERVRSRIAQGEVIQAIGRGRGVNRPKNRPLTVFVLNNAALDIPVDQVLESDCIVRPSPTDLMLAEGGVAFESGTAAALAYPQLWPTATAAQKAIQRTITWTFPYRYSFIGDCPPVLGTVTYTYQRLGPKQHRALVWIAHDTLPDPRAVVEALIGPLAFFEEFNGYE